MNKRNHIRVAVLLTLLIVGIIISGVVSHIDTTTTVALIILGFVIADGFMTFYGFYKMPGNLLSRRFRESIHLVGHRKVASEKMVSESIPHIVTAEKKRAHSYYAVEKNTSKEKLRERARAFFEKARSS